MEKNINYLNSVVEDAMKKAVMKGFKYTTLDMLFLEIIKDQHIRNILKHSNITIEPLIKAIERHILRNVEQTNELIDINIISTSLARFMNRIKMEYGNSSNEMLTIYKLFLEILDENCYGTHILSQNGFDKEFFKKIIDEYSVNDSPSSKFIIDLNSKVKKGEYDPIIGRDEEIDRLINILSRKTKNNPLIVGDPGVGKTAVVIGLVERIINNEVPDVFKNRIVKQLNINSLVSGTKFRGDFEERVEKLIDEVTKDSNVILFIDEIHTIMGAGSSSHNQGDLGEILKPILTDKKFSLIGATTYDGLKILEKDGAMMRRFQQLKIEEPSIEDSFKILKGIKPYFEDFHRVKYSDDVLKLAVTYSKKYIKDRKLPDSAIDIIDEVGAYHKSFTNQIDYSVSANDIENVISRITKMPKDSINKDPSIVIENLEDKMNRNLFNQDEAIEKIMDAIIINKSGMSDPDKPMGAFLFTGPTGVGKTEAARLLADGLGYELVRFDMGEFSESHSVSKFIGSPSGYVGFDEGGILVNKVKNNPHCVLLFDEIEKAHPHIFNTLLSVMEEGELTDGRGITAYFNNTIIIMTSNSGAVIEEKNMGFMKPDTFEQDKRADIINSQFPPEFRNRLTAIIQFNSLDRKVMGQIVDKFINQINRQVSANNKKSIIIKLDKKAKDYIIDKGYDSQMGARPLKRIINRYIEKKIAREIIFGKLKEGGIVNISVKNSELTFKYSKPRKKNTNTIEEIKKESFITQQ